MLYDRLANRWLVSQFAFTAANAPPYHECVAISKTPDPTGSYFLYDFVLPGTEFPDYPKFGVWPDGYYMTSNQFLNGGSFDGAGAFGFDRAKMLVGDPSASAIYFNLNLASHPEGIFGMLPSDHDGLLPPPAGSPNTFLYFTDNNFGDPADGLRLFDFHADFAIPASSTFIERAESTYATPLALAAFDARVPSGRAHVEQPPPAGNNTTDRLDSVGERMMFRLQYRNRNGIESLVSNFTVNVSGVTPTSGATYQAGFRYFELQKSSPGGLYGVTEQATFAPGSGNGATGDNRWLGSAANDDQDNLAVGYSISGVTAGHFPSLNYAARAFNDPPNGLFQGEGTLFAGTGVQRGTSNRWGDYSAMQVDPADDCSFWYTNEYYTTTNLTFNWQTRVGKFKFATCTAPQQGTLAGTITACDSGVPLDGATVTVSGGPSSGFSTTTIANGTYTMKLAPGSYSVTIASAPHGCTTAGPFNVTITDGSTTTQNACLTGTPNTAFESSAISGGNGDGVIDKDECDNLNVTIKSIGCLTASSVSAVLSTSTANVTITQPNSPYPNILVGSSASNTVPFSVSTSPSFVCGTTIAFTLTVNYTGGSNVLNFSLPTCACPPSTVNGSITAGDADAVSRLGRNAVISGCNAVKACPGAIDTVFTASTTRKFHLENFVNGPTAACATITFTANCSTTTNPVIPVAYLGSFDPSNLCTNYLGDPGGSPTTVGVPISFAVNVPANGTLVVSVQEVNHNQGGCSGYSVNVSGLTCNTDAGAECQACSITPPANIVVNNDPNQCGAVVTFPTPTTSGTCGVVSASPASGSFFPVGTTTVTITTTAGNTSSFTVTVNDTQPPTITCPANITVQTAPNATSTIVTYAATGSDNCPSSVLSYTPASGSTFNLGTTTVTGKNTDASGNTATCTFTVTVNQPQTIEFSSPTFAVSEGGGAAQLIVNRQGGSAGTATVDYATSDGSATQVGDYTIKLGTLTFANGETSKTLQIPIVDDVYLDDDETFNVTLSNPTGAGVSLGSNTSTIVTISDNDTTPPTSNPIDGAQFFVRQHYLDFLNRKPDLTGLNFWTNEITSCGSDPSCISFKRVNVSAAFFLSIEFQETGGFAIRTHRVAFSRKSAEPLTRITYLELIRSQSQLADGVIIGQPGADAKLEANNQAYALAVVNSSAFQTKYALAITAADFVDALFTSAGVTPTSGERSDAITAFNSQGTLALARTAALRSVSDSASVRTAEFSPSFVLMEYFGYLRRNPTDPPDGNDNGYQFWLAKLNSFGGDFQKSDMVKAFITSTEYRQRFGP